ncbi:MAG TPA: GNAT family N-acetyltransferase [Euzebyales bacterium]|nr:GNAT family N-acetyltransferase [Euzebyales bacterium]
MSGVRIRLVTDPASCHTVEDLQRVVWGLPERGVVPAAQIRAIVHNGGMLLLASDDDGSPVGFCYAFVGVEDRRPILCSHMLAVLPVARGRGIGTALTLAQREFARERGYAKITWTFDPLQARNAYLNLHRLGALARRYLVDHYGAMDDAINRGLPTDRLLAEWPATPDDPAGGDRREPASEPVAVPWILPAVSAEGPARPGALDRGPLHGPGGLVAVPVDIAALSNDDPDLPHRWRLALRVALQEAFAAGLVAVDVDRDAGAGIAAYVLERS